MGTDFNVCVQKVLEEIIATHGSVVFNGDGYSADWQIEVETRGLPNLRDNAGCPPAVGDGRLSGTL